MAERLRKRVKWSVKQLNSENAASATDEERDAYLKERWFDEKNKIVQQSPQANKVTNLGMFNVSSSREKMKVGDVVIGQKSSSWENLVFRLAPNNPSDRRYIGVSQPWASASEEKIKELQSQHIWHEVNEKDLGTVIETGSEKKIESASETKPETKKEPEKKWEPVITVQSEDKKPEEKKEEKKKETKIKKPWKVDINPFNRARRRWTRALSWVVWFPFLALAKAEATLARPQDIFYRKYRTDMGKNLLRTPKTIIKWVTWAFYRPHRKETQFEDVFKWYGPTFGPTAKKHTRFKRPLWLLSKPRKFIQNYYRSGDHFRHETIEGIKKSKRYRNPKKRNFKTFKYPKTRESFKRAFTWDKQPEENIKMDDNSKDISNAA